jgi:hypothetical protein
MTETEANELATWFFDRFPGVGASTLRALKTELMGFDLNDAKQAATEFLGTGEKFIEVSRVVAIANRIRKQRREKEAVKLNEHFKQMQYGNQQQLQKMWDDVNAWIADTHDDDLAALKADVLLASPPGARRMLEKRDPRKSTTLKGLIYERATGKRVAV